MYVNGTHGSDHLWPNPVFKDYVIATPILALATGRVHLDALSTAQRPRFSRFPVKWSDGLFPDLSNFF